MRTLLIFLFTLFLSSLMFSQEFQLPPSPVGKAVMSYFSSFNSGDTTVMKEFYAMYMADDRPLSERLRMYERMHGQLGSVRPLRLLRREGNEVDVLAESQLMGPLRFSMIFSDDTDPRLVGIGIDEADPNEQPAERTTTVEEFVERLKGEMERRVKDDQFSGVISVTKDGERIFERAYGYADREKMVGNTVRTRFNIGSINKAFTSLAVRKLIEEGKLASDDVVGAYLPEYPNEEVRRKVTVEQLLSMTSGIGDIFGERYDAARKERLRSISDYMPLFADKPLLFEPGTGRRYSNGGYIVLGRLIEVVTGEDYYAHIRRTIFGPAGMHDTDWYEKNSKDTLVAKGYTRASVDGEWVRNLASLPQRGSSAGGGYSTAEDLLRFTKALDEGTLGAKNYDLGHGFGIAGGAPGINAAVEWMPGDDAVIVVLSNLDPPSATSISRFIRDILPAN